MKYVANALAAGGLNLRPKLPTRHGSHWAKDASDVFQEDPRFAIAAKGFGGNIQGDYHAQKGDIAVWEGGKFGHIMLCAGTRPDGSPIWRCDFTAREENWTGLKDAKSHGTFKIFRQHTLDGASETKIASAGPSAPAAGGKKHHTAHEAHLVG